MDDEHIELFGRITQVPRIPYGEQKRFIVLAVESNQKYDCVCPFFCPAQVDDTIYAVVKFSGERSLVIVRPPLFNLLHLERV